MPLIRFEFRYMPAIAQLRFFAVMLVMAFHAGLNGNGFIGVDLFFVLSGFLITNVLSELSTSGMSVREVLVSFYVSRMKRLLPLASVVLVATAVASWALFRTVPEETVRGNVWASALWAQNWHLLTESDSYFTPVEVNPFSHYWSLSVEEQFYFVFPVVAVAVFTFGDHKERRRLRVLLGVVSVLIAVSLSVNLFSGISESSAYYASHARMYQILAGVALACVMRLHGGMNRPIGLSGLAGIGLLILGTSGFGLNVFHMGLAATALSVVLIFEASVMTYTNKMLELLGALSYGTYLWHWPVMLFLSVEQGLSPWKVFLVGTAVSHALAGVTYLLIEQPIKRFDFSKVRLPVPAMSGMFLSVSLAVPFLYPEATAFMPSAPPNVTSLEQPTTTIAIAPQDVSDGTTSSLPSTTVIPVTAPTPATVLYPDRPYDGSLLAYGSWKSEFSDLMTACAEDPTVNNCVLTEGNYKVHLAGDSFALVMLPAFVALAEEHGWQLSISMYTGCPWQLNSARTSDFSNPCLGNKLAVREMIRTVSPDLVITHALTAYGKNDLTNLDGTPQTDKEFEQSTLETVEFLTGLGSEIVFIESSQISEENTIVCLKTASEWGECDFVDINSENGLTPFLASLSEISSELAFVSLKSWFCTDDNVCDATHGEYAVMLDFTHLSDELLLALKDDLWKLITDASHLE